MLNKIIDRLSKHKLSGWQVREVHKTSFQSFLAKEERECVRTVDTTRYEISIHQLRDVEGKKVLGLATFRIGPADIGSLETKIKEALFSADLVSNQPFELPGPQKSYPTIQICDETLREQTLMTLEDRLRLALSKEKQTRLSAAEFFVDRAESRLVNHLGLNTQQTETLIHMELILLSTSGGKENEFIDRYSRRYLKDFNVEQEVADSARVARNATIAQLPQTGFFPVVFSGEPLDNLFNPLVARASARLKYNKMLDNELGKMVVDESSGDRVTLWSNGLLDGAIGSNRFDNYGTPSQRVCLIEKNKVKTMLADKRYADYLDVPVTGELGNIEIEGGSKPFQQLLDPSAWGVEKIYHLEAFSAFEPNAITGAFSAEIRTGTEISKEGTKPIKGGSVSGVLQKALANVTLSQERVQRERTLAPQGIHFKELAIAGD
jgi:predicted Zn-dependent protease